MTRHAPRFHCGFNDGAAYGPSPNISFYCISTILEASKCKTSRRDNAAAGYQWCGSCYRLLRKGVETSHQDVQFLLVVNVDRTDNTNLRPQPLLKRVRHLQVWDLLTKIECEISLDRQLEVCSRSVLLEHHEGNSGRPKALRALPALSFTYPRFLLTSRPLHSSQTEDTYRFSLVQQIGCYNYSSDQTSHLETFFSQGVSSTL